jgi:hypothetical protein
VASERSAYGVDRGCAAAPETGCGRTFWDSGRWSKTKAQDEGWFFQQNGAAWCPDHVPAWVAAWRAGKTAAERAKW